MQLKRGLWLTLFDEAGEATPVACDVDEQRPGLWILEALVPPATYPVTFVSARLRLDGYHLGLLRFAQPILTATHEAKEVRLEFPINEAQWEAARAAHESSPAPRS